MFTTSWPPSFKKLIMWQLWIHAYSEDEGGIDDMVHANVHKEVIDFMYEFYKKTYPEEFYSKRYEDINLPF
jgi:hypothetical protein